MKEEEQFSEHDKHVQDTPDKDNLLFHPFEKAKLIRSAGKKRDEYVENGLTSSTSLDLDKRKKTLENQKYLFKIQKQRLENQLLRRDLQTAEKALGLLVEENGILSRQESLSEFSSPRAAEEDVHRMSLSNENEESSVELKESAGESECNQPLDTKEPVHIPDEEKQVNDIDSSSTITGSDSDESTEQVGMSFVSGMSDIQRETLSKRYPNIFKGLSFVKQDKVESQSRTDSNFLMDDKQDKTIAGGLSLPKSLNATPESDVTESASRNTAKGLTTTLSHASKPRIEIERIRKYQEQLLQKQKWLKNRQNVLQKRHKEMLSEFAQADGKGRANEIQDSSTTASISLSENVGSLQVTDKPIVTSNVVEMSEEKHSIETQLECKLNAARMIDADSVVGDRMSYRDDVGTGLEEEAPVQPLGPLGTNRELAIDSSKERVFWESEIHALPDEKEEQGKLDQGDVENIFAVQRGCGMEAVGDSSSRRHSHFDGLQNLLSEIDSIHLQANTTAIERISHDIPSRGALKRSHGVVAEKPAVSPIQEVEETPYKERSVVASQDQGLKIFNEIFVLYAHCLCQFVYRKSSNKLSGIYLFIFYLFIYSFYLFIYFFNFYLFIYYLSIYLFIYLLSVYLFIIYYYLFIYLFLIFAWALFKERPKKFFLVVWHSSFEIVLPKSHILMLQIQAIGCFLKDFSFINGCFFFRNSIQHS